MVAHLSGSGTRGLLRGGFPAVTVLLLIASSARIAVAQLSIARLRGAELRAAFSAPALTPETDGKRRQQAPPVVTPAPPVRPGLTLEQRGDVFMARKSYAEAIVCYQQALEAAPERAAALWNKLGIANQLNQSYDAACKAYKRAAGLNHRFAEPWNNTGTVYFLLARYSKSVKYYKHAIRLDPRSASFHMNLGASYSRMKKYAPAVNEYRAALELDPSLLTEHAPGATVVQARADDVEFYYYLAKVFASLEKPDQSIHYLRRAFEDGFKDFRRLDGDADFQKIAKNPAYVELRKNPPMGIAD
jgi:tetratricopeptide (TPR) repeat protein